MDHDIPVTAGMPLPARAPQRRGLLATCLRGGLALLVVVDLAFCAMHGAHWLGWVTDENWMLNTDRGYPEWWQYLQAAAVVTGLGVLFGRSRQRVYLAWALVFAYALLDDSIGIHEMAGVWFAQTAHASGAYGLRAEDFGELMISGAIGVPLVLYCAWSHWQAGSAARRHARHYVWMFALLVFFGVVIDMAHIALASAGMPLRGMNVVEDGGELLAMSLAAAYTWALLRPPARPVVAPAVLHAPQARAG